MLEIIITWACVAAIIFVAALYIYFGVKK